MLPGYQTRLGIDTTNPVGRGYEFESCSLSRRDSLIDTGGMCGMAGSLASRVVQGTSSVAGVIELSPSSADLQTLLAWIMGHATPSHETLTDSLAQRVVQLDRVTDVATYEGCCVDRATISGGVGQRVRLQLQLLGLSETTQPAGSFPSVVTSHAPPCVFTDSRLHVAGNAYEVTHWTVTIDHHAQAWFGQSVTATLIRSLGRTIQLTWTGPRDETNTLVQSLRTGAAAQLRCTQNDRALSFEFACLQAAEQPQTIHAREPLMNTTLGIARRVTQSAELIVHVTGS